MCVVLRHQNPLNTNVITAYMYFHEHFMPYEHGNSYAVLLRQKYYKKNNDAVFTIYPLSWFIISWSKFLTVWLRAYSMWDNVRFTWWSRKLNNPKQFNISFRENMRTILSIIWYLTITSCETLRLKLWREQWLNASFVLFIKDSTPKSRNRVAL